MYSYGPPHMAGQKQDDQLEYIFSSYVRIRDVALKTYRRQWTIGRSGKRGLRISVLVARHDDDDDLYEEIRPVIGILLCPSLDNFVQELRAVYSTEKLNFLLNKSKKLAIVVEGDLKAPFPIATTQRCWGAHHFFNWIAPFYPWYIIYNAVLNKELSSTICKVFGMSRPGIESQSPEHSTPKPMGQYF